MLDDLEQRLRLKGQDRRLVVRELRSHLTESQKYLEACGRTPEAARNEALERFGDPGEVADMLTAVHTQRTPRLRTVAAATFLVAVTSAGFGAAGAFAAYGLGPKIPQHHTSRHRSSAARQRASHGRVHVHHLPAR
jgi:hypothetical protein